MPIKNNLTISEGRMGYAHQKLPNYFSSIKLTLKLSLLGSPNQWCNY